MMLNMYCIVYEYVLYAVLQILWLMEGSDWSVGGLIREWYNILWNPAVVSLIPTFYHAWGRRVLIAVGHLGPCPPE